MESNSLPGVVMKFHGLDQFQEWLVIDILLALKGEEDVKIRLPEIETKLMAAWNALAPGGAK